MAEEKIPLLDLIADRGARRVAPATLSIQLPAMTVAELDRLLTLVQEVIDRIWEVHADALLPYVTSVAEWDLGGPYENDCPSKAMLDSEAEIPF